MKILKPQRLGMLQRVVEHQRSHTLVVSVLVYAPLSAPRRILTEQGMWQELGSPMGGIVDEGLPKARGELLVTGSAFAPAGAPARAVMARVKVGAVDKKLAVFGERFWDGADPSEPAPFEQMPVDWAHAFGGEGFAKNPLGKGLATVATPGGKLHLLPNVEDPRRLIVSKRDRPDPAGFGPYDLTWPQRFEKIGRYDRSWLETLFPGMAADFDAAFYNRAPADQLLEGHFAGDEEIVVEGMSPAGRIDARLEKLVVRAFATQKTAEGVAWREIATRLDTVHLVPHLDRVLLSFRGTLPVAEDDADDIVHLMLAAEDPAAPRDVEHYRRALAVRLDKLRGALAGLRDEDLMPPAAAGWAAKPDPGDVGELVRTESHALQNALRGRKRSFDDTRAELAARGLDPDEFLPEQPEPPPPADPYDVDAALAQLDAMAERAAGAEAQAKAHGAQAERHARERFAAFGMDWDAERDAALQKTAGPPSFDADEHLGRLHDIARIAAAAGEPDLQLEEDISDPRYAEMLRELEERGREGYRAFAHLQLAAVTAGDLCQTRRALVQAAKDGSESLAGRDLTGADLHGLDLRGMCFAGAFLEGASFAGAVACDSDFTGAVLARADLSGANFSGACLRNANLGAALLDGVDLSDATLDGAVLVRAKLDGARLAGATLHGCDFLEAAFGSADFSNVEGDKLLWLRPDLRAVAFAGARLTHNTFIEANLDGVDFTGCDLSGTQFLGSRGEGACFAGALLASAVFVPVDGGTGAPALAPSFAHARFTAAALDRANFRAMTLSAADFSGASLAQSDLGKADLRGARLCGVRARGAVLMRADLRGADLRGADLLEALMAKADVRGADLAGSNLSRADVSLVRVDHGTNIDGALMLDTRVDPRRPPDPPVAPAVAVEEPAPPAAKEAADGP